MAEPSPRSYHFSAAIDRQLCIYGGSLGGGESELSTTLHVFSSDAERWKVTETTGMNPPQELREGASTSSNLHLFLFGGTDNSDDYSSLYRLDAMNLQWSELSRTVDEEAPMAKSGGRIIKRHNHLIVFGGGGHQRKGHRFQAEAQYEDVGSGQVLTNELHNFNLKEGECVGLPSQYLK